MRARSVVVTALGLMLAVASVAEDRLLRVCSDPNNLPFSNRAGEGFENRLAELIAGELDAELSYIWWAQRRGFIRNTLDAGHCDLVMGVPAGYELVETTRPYYRSTYVFVYRADLGKPLRSLDDTRLRHLAIGVHLIGDDGANPPPAHALALRGIVDNVAGYMIYGDYREANPPARLIDAVADRTLDAAAVWGPLGGYFAHRARRPLAVQPIEGTSPVPLEFSIAMGVRKGDVAFRDRIQQILDRRRDAVHRVLVEFHVPLVAPAVRHEEAAR